MAIFFGPCIMAHMETLLVLLRSSYDDGSWLLRIIVAVVVGIIVSAIRSGKKKAKSFKNSSNTPSAKSDITEPPVENNHLDKILGNQEKMNQISQSKEDSIWEDDKTIK